MKLFFCGYCWFQPEDSFQAYQFVEMRTMNMIFKEGKDSLTWLPCVHEAVLPSLLASMENLWTICNVGHKKFPEVEKAWQALNERCFTRMKLVALRSYILSQFRPILFGWEEARLSGIREVYWQTDKDWSQRHFWQPVPRKPDSKSFPIISHTETRGNMHEWSL